MNIDQLLTHQKGWYHPSHSTLVNVATYNSIVPATFICILHYAKPFMAMICLYNMSTWPWDTELNSDQANLVVGGGQRTIAGI